MKKVVLIAALAIGLVAFVGTDVLKSSVGSVREAVRDALTAEVPLSQQLAEAQAQVDAYAESIIRGEVAAENLRDMIGGVQREVRALTVRVDRERKALAALRTRLGADAVPAGLTPDDGTDERRALRRVRAFEAANQLLVRRTKDLERLETEYKATLDSLAKARGEQIRLGEEIHVLAAELESLHARKAAARTRDAVGDSSVSSSGYAEAQERIRKIRTALREQNKLLQYYEYERRPVSTSSALDVQVDVTVGDPRSAIDEALAAFPGR